ncbi:MAG TPA: hypothetical protein VJ697_02345 [Nitrososphaeraceae archaeon]|nr:hypothetical protein [Nitrososphaeraceae archaeon]
MKGYVKSRKPKYQFNLWFIDTWYDNIDKLYEYFKYLNKSNIVNIKLSKASYFTLYQFIKFNNYLSTNDICNLLKYTVYEADYKNILKKMKYLHLLGLIEVVKPDKLPERRNMIFYKLSSSGIIYLFHKLTDYEGVKINKFIEYYKNDNFFKIFLFQNFEVTSLINIQREEITNIIFEYCIEICKEIINELEIFNKMENNGGYEVPYLYWSNFLKYNISDESNPNYRKIGEFLYSTMKQDRLYWLKEENIEFNKVDNMTVTFSYNQHKLMIKIDEKNKQALVFYNEEELGYYTIKREYNDFLLYSIQFQDIDDVMSHVRIRFRSKI